jgi:hypothetical protein
VGLGRIDGRDAEREAIAAFDREASRLDQAVGLAREVAAAGQPRPRRWRRRLAAACVRPYEQIVAWLQGRFAGAAEPPDLHALALVLVESISAYDSLRRAFGRTPDDVDDERFIAAWAETALAVARRYGIDERA